jgi:hypothetical protein
MDLDRRIRKLIYVPQLSGGRKTFLHFYWDGRAYSLREYSDPNVAPRPRYRADVGLPVEKILSLAVAPGSFSIDQPAVPNDDIRFWYRQTVEANRRHLGIEPDPAKERVSASTNASRVVRPAVRTIGPLAGYGDELRARLWRYRAECFAAADDLFDERYQPGGMQPPVFKTEQAHRNVLVKPGARQEEIKAVSAAIPTGRRHKWFRSMTSSQALAQSVFANLQYHNKLALLADLRGDDRLPCFPRSVARPRNSWSPVPLQLEYQVDTLGEPRPTSVDVMFGGDYRVAVECKLSEPEVGACSRPDLRPSDSNYASDHCDGTYTRQRGRRTRCALTERGTAYWRYIPKLFTWSADGDMRPCPLHATYQLVRNVLAASVREGGHPEPDGHAVLIYDARNPAFAEGGKGNLAWQKVRDALKNPALLRRCTWQELVACLRQDEELNWLTEALRDKYGL